MSAAHNDRVELHTRIRAPVRRHLLLAAVLTRPCPRRGVVRQRATGLQRYRRGLILIERLDKPVPKANECGVIAQFRRQHQIVAPQTQAVL